MTLHRRQLLAAAAWLPWSVRAAPADADAAAAIAAGGVVVALRHALAPGTFDPPGFRLGDCATQRNLSDAGRDQARRIGRWFADRRLVPAAVRTSPWCRCIDTATLAFGGAEVWPALGSPRGSTEQAGAEHLRQLQDALVGASLRPGRFEVWVTHMFVLADWVGTGAASGEGLVLRAVDGAPPQVLARIAPR